jgi:hypothetical protein
VTLCTPDVIKTYIIESNISAEYSRLSGNFELINTSDATLKLIRFRSPKKGIIDLYLDAADARFWKVYSLHDSSITDELIKQMIMRNNSKLDYLWLPSTLLERYMDLGKQTGFNIRFKNKFNFSNNEDEIGDVSMRFWGGRGKEIINSLRKDTPMDIGVSLSSISIRHSIEGGSSKENITGRGRFTIMKGNSIDSHLLLMNKIKNDYQKILELIESQYRANIRKTNYGIEICENSLSIELPNEIEYMDDFINTVFSGELPFRLTGTIEKCDKYFYRVYGIDLHTNDLINFEITPNLIVMHLNTNSCGNVITRLVTNLQTYMNHKIKLVGENDTSIL